MKKKFNIVDALLILLILAACAVCFLFLRSRGTVGAVQETSPMRFTVELRDVRPAVVAQMAVGGRVYRSTDNTYLGTLADVSTQPNTKTEYSQTLERYVTYECEGVSQVYLVIENDGYETAGDIVIGGNVVKIGDEMYVKGKGYAGSGYIVGLDTMSAPAVENTAVGSGDETIEYKARFDAVRDFTADAFHIGDRVYDNATGALLGEVTDIALEPYSTAQMDAEGKPLMAQMPDRCTVLLTLRGRCAETEDGYYLDSRSELKLGSELIVKTKYIKSQLRYHEILSVGD